MSKWSKNELFRYLIVAMLVIALICIVVALILKSRESRTIEHMEVSELLQQYWDENNGRSINKEAGSINSEHENPTSNDHTSNDPQLPNSNAVTSTSAPQNAPIQQIEIIISSNKDNESIHVEAVTPSNNQTTTSISSSATEQGSNKLDINQATLEELQQLKGIGPSKAKAIIADRESKGNFKNINDIKRVKGIGEKLFAGIKESIVVNL